MWSSSERVKKKNNNEFVFLSTLDDLDSPNSLSLSLYQNRICVFITILLVWSGESLFLLSVLLDCIEWFLWRNYFWVDSELFWLPQVGDSYFSASICLCFFISFCLHSYMISSFRLSVSSFGSIFHLVNYYNSSDLNFTHLFLFIACLFCQRRGWLGR